MISAVFKRSIIIDGHKTSVTLEDEFWGALLTLRAEKTRGADAAAGTRVWLRIEPRRANKRA